MISIIIATFNRCSDLRLTLQSIAAALSDPCSAVEVLVMDNNSSDQTRQVVEEMAPALNIRYAFEPRPGKSRALNRAVTMAKGELFLFTDDDVTVDHGWFAAYRQAMGTHPTQDFFGGKVISAWQCEPPQWFRENQDWLHVTPKLDMGEAKMLIDQSNRRFFLGANMAVRRRAFDDGLRFNENFGPLTAYGTSTARHGSEDGLLQSDLLAHGSTGLYVPDAVVHHRDKAERMTRKYVRWFYRQHAREEILCGSLPPSMPQVFGVPGYVWRNAVQSALGWTVSRWFSTSSVWLKHEVQFHVAMERIHSFRKIGRDSLSPIPRAD
jgi:glycosyltransferase involved in cell wall biosynthesis